ncbi:MAG: SMC family ATPase [Desulfurococcus sp.]|nr:SMC family ATPase [Desulfurococcus sp.]
MRIYGLVLENIRSFKRGRIVFPKKGVTVIHGETGSGKTSILMAVSAALFGLAQGESGDPFRAFAYPTGRDLLRANASEGSVRLLFEHEGKLYLVERRFRREGYRVVSAQHGRLEEYTIDTNTGRIVNTGSWILSPTELNKRIKRILGIKEKAREQPLLFTSVLYAPQFNIHEVLSLSEERRREVVERSLGLTRYKEYRRNSEEVKRLVRSKIEELTQRIRDVKARLQYKSKENLLREKAELEEQLKNLEEKRRQLENTLRDLRSRIDSVHRELGEIRREIGELEGKIKHAIQLKEELERTRRELDSITSAYSLKTPVDVRQLIEKLEVERRKLEEQLKAKSMEEEELEQSLEVLQETRKKLSEENLASYRGEIKRVEADIKYKSREREELREQYNQYLELVNKGVCPLCRQPIPHEHGRRLIAEISSRIEALNKEIEELESRKLKLEEEEKGIIESIKRIDEAISEKRNRRNQVKKELNDLREEIRRLDIIVEKVNGLVKRIEELERKLEESRDIKKLLEAARRKLTEVENQLDEYKRQEKSLEAEEKKLNSIIAEIKGRVGFIEQVVMDIERDEESLRKLENEKKLHEWILELLKSLDVIAEEIEKRISLEMIRDFRRIFYEVLEMLTQDQPVEVYVRDDFTLESKVRIGGKSYTISSLSGGQSIAVSLAYRLALNVTARKYSSFLRRTTLILDEPTTGFSQELVRRLGEVLRSIGEIEGQVIVVTHDELLKNIGDCRIMLERDQINHESRVGSYECVGAEDFDVYKSIVEGILEGRYRAERNPATPTGSNEPGFKPTVRLGVNDELQSVRGGRSILDYFK